MARIITPELREKMNAGIRKAAEARKAAKSTAGMAAGHERDEQRKINADLNEQRLEERSEKLGMESIDEGKFRKRDRETMARIEDSKDGVENPLPGYRYFRVTISDQYRTHGAKAAIRDMHQMAKKFGAEAVREDMPEDKKYKGNDGAAGSSLRGLADTVLYRITEENAQRMEAHFKEKERRMGGVEEQTVIYARSRGVGTMHGAAGDFASQDPLLGRIAGDAGRVETFTRGPEKTLKTTWTEGDIRRGSARGPDGRTLQPGFETRAGR